MSSLTLPPRTSYQTAGIQPAEEALGSVRDDATPGAVAAVRPDYEVGRWEGVAVFVRILAGTVAFYAVLIRLPLLALMPIVVVGLFLGVIGTLFGGMV